MRFVCGDVRDLIVSYKKRPRPFVSALQSVAAVEAPKNQLLRDFRYRSILDFCNNICQQRTFTNAPAQARPFEGASISTSASVHPRRAGWGDVRIHLRVRSAGAAAARAATAFSDGSRQPGGHGWIWRIPQRFLPLQPKKAHSVAATAESIQSVDFGGGVELGRVLIKREMSASLIGVKRFQTSRPSTS